MWGRKILTYAPMQNISREVCRRLKEARRSLGLKQTELAREIGCHQAALSMFERGNPSKLSGEYVKKLAARLGVDIDALAKEPEAGDVPQESARAFPAGYCPDSECPSNEAYRVGGRTFFRISLQRGRYCAHCGEVLETCCPKCGAAVNAGACCTECGTRYVR